MNRIHDLNVTSIRDPRQSLTDSLKPGPEALPPMRGDYNQSLRSIDLGPGQANQFARRQVVTHEQHRVDARITSDADPILGHALVSEVRRGRFRRSKMQLRQ